MKEETNGPCLGVELGALYGEDALGGGRHCWPSIVSNSQSVMQTSERCMKMSSAELRVKEAWFWSVRRGAMMKRCSPEACDIYRHQYNSQ